MKRLPIVRATRYVTPLREGGSLPGLVEADDLGTYVVKFTGAGQGPAALVAEVVATGLAQALGLPTPELAVIEVDPLLGGAEPDQEVQELLLASPGPNLAVDFLPGALDFTAAAGVTAQTAGEIVWFDALIGNVDRSWRNPNLLWWHGRLWLIDHGASLTFLHGLRPGGPAPDPAREYDVSDHALLGLQPDVASADDLLGPQLDARLIAEAVAAVPAAWLGTESVRAVVADWLTQRWLRREEWLPTLVTAAGRAPGLRPARGPVGAGRPGWLQA